MKQNDLFEPTEKTQKYTLPLQPENVRSGKDRQENTLQQDPVNIREKIGKTRRDSRQTILLHKPESVEEMIGKACRDCINFEFNINITRDDCKYERRSDGHRVIKTCYYCNRTRPLVIGLKLSGKAKLLISRFRK